MTEEEWELVKMPVKAFAVGHPDSLVLTVPIEVRKILADKIVDYYAVYIRRSDGAVMYKPLAGFKRGR